jgi:hypothetical protein
MEPEPVVVWMWDIVLGINVGKALGWASSVVISSRYLWNSARLVDYRFDRVAGREVFSIQGSCGKCYYSP